MSNIVPETLKEQVSVWANKETKQKSKKNINTPTFFDCKKYNLLTKPMSVICFKFKQFRLSYEWANSLKSFTIFPSKIIFWSLNLEKSASSFLRPVSFKMPVKSKLTFTRRKTKNNKLYIWLFIYLHWGCKCKYKNATSLHLWLRICWEKRSCASPHLEMKYLASF